MQSVTFVFLFATATFGIHGVDLIFIFGILLWMAMLVDCLHFNTTMPWKQKVLWILTLIFIAPVGTILYFLIAFLGRFLVQKEQHIPTKEMHRETYTEYEQKGINKKSNRYIHRLNSHISLPRINYRNLLLFLSTNNHKQAIQKGMNDTYCLSRFIWPPGYCSSSMGRK